MPSYTSFFFILIWFVWKSVICEHPSGSVGAQNGAQIYHVPSKGPSKMSKLSRVARPEPLLGAYCQRKLFGDCFSWTSDTFLTTISLFFEMSCRICRLSTNYSTHVDHSICQCLLLHKLKADSHEHVNNRTCEKWHVTIRILPNICLNNHQNT